ncbi:MAG: glucose-6-phosphate isomerase [Calditrichae bacterium]|nr:glucose-6-phosphate isomerase [Calditrichota bacterium]MCB9058121.1 glucose-6-phosphate isomerase [Calditrichia bacterium]
MKVNLDYSNVVSSNIGAKHGIDINEIELLAEKGRQAAQSLEQKIENGTLGFYNLPSMHDIADEVLNYTASIKDRFTSYVHVGIGGSALGPIALQSSLRHTYYNNFQKPKMYFPDNVDPDWLAELIEQVDIKKTLFHIVSKSGGTAETAATLLYFMNFLKEQLGESFYKNLLFTTDPHKGLLNQIALENAIKCFRIPNNVGGRFSVLTPLGLVPAALAGADIKALLKGAEEMAVLCRRQDVMKNPAFIYAAIHTIYMSRGKNISVMMPYSNKLKDISDWYGQLWAESLGKRFDNQKNVIEVGQTPVKALGATDQHSQVQLYVEGPNDKVITFMEVENFKENVILKNHFPYIKDFNYLEGKTLGGLLNSEKKATEIALTNNERPNLTIKMSEVSPENIGATLFFFQAATAFAGELLNINAFDQPGVEEGKIATYALMGREGYDKKKKEIEEASSRKKEFIL